MPWTANDAKKKYKKLTKKQSEVWASVANSSLESGDDEATAIKKANAAVQRMRKSEAYADAAAIVVEAGRMISSANMTKLKTAMQSMKAAIDTIMPLMADDANEEVEESSNLQEVEVRSKKWELVTVDEAAKILAQSDSYDAVRCAVSSALRQRAISNKMAQVLSDGSVPGYDDYYDYGSMPYIRDLYDGYVVYSISGQLYQCEYTIDNDVVSLGDETEVQVSYVPITQESKQIEVQVKGNVIKLEEKAIQDDNTVEICLITPGWGSSGYYSEDMLKRDGSKVFPKGTHMYMNHPTEEEDRIRPERDVRDLAGVVESDVQWKDNGFAGKGLYAKAKVFPNYKDFIDEAAAHIGISIRAAGTAIEGEAENRHGLLVDSLTEGFSVDYVTMAGRGGQILPLYESARSKLVVSETKENGLTVQKVEVVETNKDTVTMEISEKELNELRENAGKASTLETKLNESNALVTSMQKRMLMSEARVIVIETLSGIELPSVASERVRDNILRSVPLTDNGDLDSDKLIEQVKETAANELKYIETVTGNVTGGKVVGMSQPAAQELNAEEVNKEFEESWRLFGLDEGAAKIAANGR